MPINRRSFLRSSFAAGLASTFASQPLTFAQDGASSRKFKIDLTPGALGIGARGRDVIELAHAHGFESVQPDSSFLASLDDAGLAEVMALMKEKELVWGSAGLPVDFRGDEERFKSGMAELPKHAAALQSAGATRISTYLMPMHGSLTYMANFELHKTRLKEITRVTADHGLRFGLEYVGTKTLWTRDQYPFVHTMAETKDLIAAVDEPTLGFVLDSWHWTMAGESADDLLTLSNSDVIACDLNDAPVGIKVDQQQDNRRELPAATGVIDISAFLNALAKIGYDGPVRAEPFNQPLNAMDDAPAAAATSAAIRKAMELAKVL